MRKLISLALASASVAAIASAASAQQSPSTESAAAPEATLGEIVVTARRKSESLQEVPQTVNAVTAETLQKLNIRKFEDVQTVVPGLSLSSSSTGFAAAASLRGVTYDVGTNAQPTVALYMNDAPMQALFLFQSIFDVGQVEVLKGPQGTTRGISAPSGAITVTTRKPSLSEFGGYIDTTLTDLGGRNVQGAVNVPLIKDVLALRAAAVIDQNRFDGVTSLHNGTAPKATTSAERISLSFEPNDAFDANISYQHLDHSTSSFQQVSGPGNAILGNPPISPDQRVGVQDGANQVRQHFDVVTAQVDSRLFGQHLSYVGSYQNRKVTSLLAEDQGDVLPGVEFYQSSRTPLVVTSQEFRVASDPAPGRFFDYTVGAFYQWQNGAGGQVNQPAEFLPGAFGTQLGVVNLSAFNPAYQVPLTIDLPATIQETSLFGSVTLHLGPNTELSGGIRHIWSISSSHVSITTGNGLINLGGIPCSLLGAAPGPGAGDCILNTAGPAGGVPFRDSETPNIYNVSLSHHFTRDFLVYANTGTAYRPALPTIGIQGDLSSSTVPVLAELNSHPAERSRSYEIGFKSSWFDERVRLNASMFRQHFNNLIVLVPNIQYLNSVTNTSQSFDFTSSVDALVQGFDIDAAVQVTPEWNVSAQMSYADGKIQNSLVPCNINNAAGNPVFNTGGLISLCPGRSASRLPLWNATFTSEYVHPVFDGVDGFFRLLATYYPENKNRVEPDFTVPNYSLVNLYLGLRSHDGAWEASIFARNAFKAQRVLDRSPAQLNLNGPLSLFPTLTAQESGYYTTSTTPQREVGINVHYAFGSR